MEVKINLDVYAFYEDDVVVYRIWLDNHLFLERKFWIDCLHSYIEEELHADLEPGSHVIMLEKLKPPLGKVWAEKLTVSYNDTKKNYNFEYSSLDKHLLEFTIE